MSTAMTHPDTHDSRNEYEKLVAAAKHVHSRIKNVHPYAPDGRKDQSYPPPPPDKPEQEETAPLHVVLRHGDIRAHCDVGFVYEEDSQVCGKSPNPIDVSYAVACYRPPPPPRFCFKIIKTQG